MRDKFVSLCTEKGTHLLGGGGVMNALMFQKSNSDFIQQNSIRSAKNLQGKKNCKGYFPFFENNCFYFYMIYLVGTVLE